MLILSSFTQEIFNLKVHIIRGPLLPKTLLYKNTIDFIRVTIVIIIIEIFFNSFLTIMGNGRIIVSLKIFLFPKEKKFIFIDTVAFSLKYSISFVITKSNINIYYFINGLYVLVLCINLLIQFHPNS